jgi:putative transport protein
VNRTVAELEALPREFRVFITRVRHDGAIIESEPTSVIHQGDVVAVMTRTEALMARGTVIGPEVDDKELLNFPQEHLDVVITNKAIAGKTLREMAASDFARGVFLRKLLRGEEPMPFTLETRIDRGDVMRIVGSSRDVERAAKELGYADRPTSATDMVFVGARIVLGGFVGLLSITLGNLPISLTASGGALIMGLIFGWLRSVRPTFGRIPEAAMWASTPSDSRPSLLLSASERAPVSSRVLSNQASAWSSWAFWLPCCPISRRSFLGAMY